MDIRNSDLNWSGSESLNYWFTDHPNKNKADDSPKQIIKTRCQSSWTWPVSCWLQLLLETSLDNSMHCSHNHRMQRTTLPVRCRPSPAPDATSTASPRLAASVLDPRTNQRGAGRGWVCHYRYSKKFARTCLLHHCWSCCRSYCIYESPRKWIAPARARSVVTTMPR